MDFKEREAELLREIGLISMELHSVQRQLRASDHRSAQMVRDCPDRDKKKNTCRVDNNAPCRNQCGDRGVRRIDGVLVK